MMIMISFLLLVTIQIVSCNYMYTETAADHQLRNVTVLNRSFLVGSVHADWVPTYEMENLKAFDQMLSPKIGQCVVVDVGMNDGFYTHFSTSYGCKVWAFEIQSDCISFSHKIAKANNASHLINIIRAPVSDLNGESMAIPAGDEDQRNRCDGGFSLSGAAHKPFQITHYRHLDSVALGSLFPLDLKIDVLKIDVEGHEPAALEGALELFKSNRVRRCIVEVTPKWWKVDREKGLAPFQKIFSYGYLAKCLSGESKVTGRQSSFNEFEQRVDHCIDWDFYPIQ